MKQIRQFNHSLLSIGAAFLVLIAGSFLATTRSAAQTRVDFRAEVEPILAKNCQSCHGAKTQLGQFRLDAASAAMAGGQSGKAIIPGDAANSILYQRVAGIGDQVRMPMGGKLAAEQIETIRRWIAEGATWPDSGAAQALPAAKHWSFVPPVRPALPKVSRESWCANPIDSFVLAKLDQEKLQPSAEATRVTLLRRLSLDLTGLPPSPGDVDNFLRDDSPDAYRKQVRRLLASPHYGERWGRLWLDAARFADSDGYEKDKPREVWAYRDWVIRALNQDLPWDRFIVSQIAGDLLPDAKQDDIVATGFLRNSMINEEGGVDPEQFRMEAMFDRMDAIGKSVLGVTVQCAQCHNHKFDPVLHEDYYRMMAYLNDVSEARVAVCTPAEQKRKAEIGNRVLAIEDGLKTPGWQLRMNAWEDSLKPEPEWVTLPFDPKDLVAGGQKLRPQPDGSLLAQGDPGTNIEQDVLTKSNLKSITAMRLELLTDSNLPRNGPGRGSMGTFALTELTVHVKTPAAGEYAQVKIASASSDLDLPAVPLPEMFAVAGKTDRILGPVHFAIDGKTNTAWGVDAGPALRNQARKAVFVFEKPIVSSEGVSLKLHLAQNHGGSGNTNNLGRFRLSVTSESNPVADPLPEKVRRILAVPRAQRSKAQNDEIFHYWRTTVAAWDTANRQIAELWREHPEGASQLVLHRPEYPRQTRILSRGDYTKPAKLVTPGVPAFLNPMPAGDSSTRLDFARWLTDRQSPTTARTIVNRIWQAYFGTGIVATSEDLGTQADAPSHRELLDWLAVDFMENGWSLKKLHEQIVMSATYRQSSIVTPDLLQRDPQNRLLARGARFRLDAETIRDVALAAGGLLNLAVGGPSVYPPAPEFLFRRPVSFSDKTWYTSIGPQRYRRALYTFRYRSVPYPMLQMFDAPSGEVSCVRRPRSNTPLQALTMLNEPLFIEAAQELARRVLSEQGRSETERIRDAFRLCVARMPGEAETSALRDLVEKLEQRFSEGGKRDPMKFAGLADRPIAGVSPAKAAAWTAVARVLLNMDETITKE
ncbi:MAG: PSD1 and planctomycete cytochrome C domain-containing protein [Bryobacteraceae bacterium]